MTLNELRFIVAVAQERNFRRAAEKAFISQPALSLAIQKLEDELGLKIFERGKNEVSLTPVGGEIVEQAQRVLEEAERIREIAAQGKNQLITPLRLGIIHSVSPYLLPDLIPELRKLAPHMALEVEENITANLDVMLRNGKLDVIIIALPFGDSGILTRALYDESFEVVVNSDHRWATRRSIKPAELAPEKVLLLDSGLGSIRTFEPRSKRLNIECAKYIELARFSNIFVRMYFVRKIMAENGGIFLSHFDGFQNTLN
jgi:LysR family hydrogen peroxide-inducible transcriptional activator